MKIIYNHLIPLPGFKAMLFYNLLFVRSGSTMSERDLNHESIHNAQMQDYCKWIPIGGTIFYIVYLFFWIKNLFTNPKSAYRSIPFEKEAYACQSNLSYLNNRKPFAWKNF